MTFFARILRFLFWLLILSWGVAVLRRVIRWMLRGGVSAPPQSTEAPGEGIARRLVRDPVCGMHVAEALAIPLREGDQILHFCSTACRDQYIANSRRFVANG
jgi:YHS domain-containing protein